MKTSNQRWWDVPSAIFLVGALFTAAIRLQLTNWTEHLGKAELIVILGAVFGFALGKSIFHGRITFLIGLVYSLFFIPWQLCLLIPDRIWPERLSLVYARLWYAIADLLASRPVKDPILFISTMLILYWFASLLSSYRLVRHANPWLPLLSLGGMILVIEYTVEMYRYSQGNGGTYSFLYLVFCLLLLGRIYFLRSKKEWENRGGTVEMEVGYDLGRGVAVAAVVVALLAWNTPKIINFFDNKNPARERVTQSWQAFRDRISKAATSLRSSNPTVVESYGSNMFLGTGGTLSDKVVFTVKPSDGRQLVRMYWAARTYDNYSNSQWQSTMGGTLQVGPEDADVVYPAWQMRRDVLFTFNSQVPLTKTLYYTNETVSISRAAQAVVSRATDGSTDLNTIVLDPPLKAGETYNIRASIPMPSVLSMREAGEGYPDWVKQRYLQVPTGFSPRVIELAKQIAGGEKTPYDKTIAVTQYLRRTITYSETIPEPPRGREPLDWFLFDLRAGFCNYYASAEVMMLRSLGVPARLVVGYAEGAWEPDPGEYVVRGKESHAWPEIYFPNVGWVAFEPTVSQPLNSFPAGDPADLSVLNNNSQPQMTVSPAASRGDERAQHLLDDELAAQQRSQQVRSASIWTILIFAVIALICLLVFLEWRRRKTQDLPLSSWFEKTLDERGIRTPGWLRLWSRRSLRTPMENLFSNVSWMLRVWGHKLDPSLTPAEQVEVLVRVVPGVKDQAATLLEEYQRAMYSPYPANIMRAKNAVIELRTIGYKNWFMHLVGLES